VSEKLSNDPSEKEFFLTIGHIGFKKNQELCADFKNENKSLSEKIFPKKFKQKHKCLGLGQILR
jgi:hypothetical protein